MELLRHGFLSNLQRQLLPHSNGAHPSAAKPFQLRNLLTGTFLASSPVAIALDYEELIQKSSSATSAAAAADSGSGGVDLGSILGFVADNPTAVVGGALTIGLPLLISRLISGNQAWGVVSAADAFDKLGSSDLTSQLLDIREASIVKAEGTPNLKQIKKRAMQLAYTGEDDEAFVQKVVKKFKDPENTVLFVLDRFDGNSAKVAKLLATSGFKGAYAIRDGAEGKRGWKMSELPWTAPRKGLSINLDSFKDAFQFEGDLAPATLGLAAAAGLGVAVFSEAETALQFIGTVALLQIFVKKLLFAENRKKTISELKTFLDTKVAPQELVDELKGVLPNLQTADDNNGAVKSSEEKKAAEEAADLPAKAKIEEQPAKAEPKAEPTAEPVKAAASTRPLSPYAQYPGLKPPSSPTPSRP